MTKRRTDDQGYVYVFGSHVDRGTREAIKVGKASNVRSRLNSMRTGNQDMYFIAATRSGQAAVDEKRIHNEFSEYRCGGEWFYRTDRVAEWVQWFIDSDNVATDLNDLEKSYSNDDCMPWNVNTYGDGMLPLRGEAMHAPAPKSRAATNAGPDVSSSESHDWITPPDIIEKARRVLGRIDLDPMSSVEANEVVKADKIYTQTNDGRHYKWVGRVWLNPPFGREKEAPVEKMLRHYRAGDIEAGIICLSSNAMSTHWFAQLFDYPICISLGRPDFTPPGGNGGSSPSKGCAFVYLGKDVQAFHEIFSQVGTVVVKFGSPMHSISQAESA